MPRWLDAHGTGTLIGDSIEAGSCGAAAIGERLCVGGLKANTAHTEGASGLPGLLRAAMACASATAPPNAQLRVINTHVKTAFESQCMCYLPVHPSEMYAANEDRHGSSLSGLVDAFGMSGTIASAVVSCNPTSQHRGLPDPMLHTERPTLEYHRRTFKWQSVSPLRPVIAKLVSSPFSVAAIDADTPLMGAGLKSNQSVLLAARLRELSGVALPATLIFECPTPRAISCRITAKPTHNNSNTTTNNNGHGKNDRKENGHRDKCGVDLLPLLIDEFMSSGDIGGSNAELWPVVDSAFGVGMTAALAASTFQAHFVLLHLLQPDIPAYSLPVAIEWPNFIPEAVMRASVQLLVRRQAVLRTLYQMDQSRVLQIILPADGFVVPLDESDDYGWIASSARALSAPFALLQAPPMRALLQSSAARQRSRLLVVVDHVAADYASMLLICKELRAACDALRQRVSVALPVLSLQYADFALWQQRDMARGASTLDWWRDKLSGAPQLLELPTNHPRVPTHEADCSSVDARVDSQLAAAIVSLCTRERVSTLCGLLASWASLLLHLSGQSSVILGQPHSVQPDHAELHDVIGCFATPIPVCITAPDRETTFAKMLRDAYVELLQSIEHANIPLLQIVQALGPSFRSTTYNALFQSMVQLLPRGATDAIEPASNASHLQGMDLLLNLVECNGGGFGGMLMFNAAIFDKATAEGLVTQLISLLLRGVLAPDVCMDGVMKSKATHAEGLHDAVSRHRGIIRQGDRCISPVEIEEVLRRQRTVHDAIAFAVPHRDIGEAVGVMVALHGGCMASLRDLRAATAIQLAPRWLPEALVYAEDALLDATPHLSGGGTPAHVLAAKLGLPELPFEHSTREACMASARVAVQPAGTTVQSSMEAPQLDELLGTVLNAARARTCNEGLAADAPLMDSGLDSLSAVQLALQLEQQTGIALPPTLIFQFSTADAIARHLHSAVTPRPCEEALQHCPDIRVYHQRTCITGTAARWPGGVASTSELSRLANTGFNCVGQVPSNRWATVDDDERYPAVRYSACVARAELFDNASFAVSPAEAVWMDPQQRMLLETGYRGLHHATHDRGTLLAHDVGVAVGIQAADFADLTMATPAVALPVYAVSGFTFSVAAGRLSYVLGMQGACFNTDTACSTALVAAHLAVTMVRDAECEGALTLAVNLMLLPQGHLLVAIAQMTSPDGRCKFLDSHANGYVRSEGVGAAFLETEREGPSEAVRTSALHATAVRSDGRSASLTAPNGEAQVRLLRATLRLCSMDAKDVGMTECHGTGTALGDPIELTALREVLMPASGSEIGKARGGIKASVGHMEPSAGMVGLFQLRSALQNARVATNAQLRVLNPHVSRALLSVACGLPVLLAASMGTHRHRSGGVSSFGYSGTIAHAILDDTGEDGRPRPEQPPRIYRRRAFPWQDVASSMDAVHHGTYASCWASVGLVDASPSGLLLLMPAHVDENGRATVVRAWQVVVVFLTDGASCMPSLRGVQLSLALTQQLLTGHLQSPRLRVIARSEGGMGGAFGTAFGVARGFARTLRLEHSALRTQSAAVFSHGAHEAALLALTAAATESETSWRASECLAARLRTGTAILDRGGPSSRGLYVITGGFGGLGLGAAALVFKRGASAVLLTSRSGHMARNGHGLEVELRSMSTVAAAVACDSADAPDVGAMLSAHSVSGVLHAAGMLRDRILRSMVAYDLDASFAPKALAASHLQVAMTRTALEAVGLFSSVASLFGNVGQGNYAAANAYLDALVSCRRQRGLLASSLQIPAVKGAGMGAASFDEQQLDAMGAISLNGLAIWLAHILTPALTAAERTQARLSLELLDLVDARAVRFEMPSPGSPTPACEEDALIQQQASSLPLRSNGDQYVRLMIAEGVSRLELNDPLRFNTLSMAMASDMQAAVRWLTLQERSAKWSVLLQGMGEHFCPGGNPYVKEASPSPLAVAARMSVDLFDGFCRLRTLPAPVTCAVHGAVLGGGLALCLLTDHVTSSSSTTFQVGERSRAIYPAGLLTRTLAEAMGSEAASGLYLTEAKLESKLACEAGLVQTVVPSVSDAQQHAYSLARQYVSSVHSAAAEVQSDLWTLSGELCLSDRRVLAVSAFAQARSMHAKAMRHPSGLVGFTCGADVLTRDRLRGKVQAVLVTTDAITFNSQRHTPPDWKEITYALDVIKADGSTQNVLTQLLWQLTSAAQTSPLTPATDHVNAQDGTAVGTQRVRVTPVAADFTDALVNQSDADPLEALMAAYDRCGTDVAMQSTHQGDATLLEGPEPMIDSEIHPCMMLLRHARAAANRPPLIIVHSLLGAMPTHATMMSVHAPTHPTMMPKHATMMSAHAIMTPTHATMMPQAITRGMGGCGIWHCFRVTSVRSDIEAFSLMSTLLSLIAGGR